MYHDWANDLIGYLIEQSPDLREHTVTSVRSKYSDLSDKQFVDALHEKYLPKHPAYGYGFAEIDSRYRADQGGQKTFDSRVGWLAVALGIPALLYLAGFSIAWIRAGFLMHDAQRYRVEITDTHVSTARAKLILGFSIFLGTMLAAATAVVAYAAYQMQAARFGDIFDRLVSQQTQTWVLPTLVVIVGISLVGFIVFIGLWKSHQTNFGK